MFSPRSITIFHSPSGSQDENEFENVKDESDVIEMNDFKTIQSQFSSSLDSIEIADPKFKSDLFSSASSFKKEEKQKYVSKEVQDLLQRISSFKEILVKNTNTTNDSENIMNSHVSINLPLSDERGYM